MQVFATFLFYYITTTTILVLLYKYFYTTTTILILLYYYYYYTATKKFFIAFLDELDNSKHFIFQKKIYPQKVKVRRFFERDPFLD